MDTLKRTATGQGWNAAFTIGDRKKKQRTVWGERAERKAKGLKTRVTEREIKRSEKTHGKTEKMNARCGWEKWRDRRGI